MSSENEKVDSEIKYAWRPATEADIGSVARFCDVRAPHNPWSYGILFDIEQDEFDPDFVCLYVCDYGVNAGEETVDFYFCEIQYVADENP